MEFVQDNVRKEYGKIALENHEESIMMETVSSESMSASVGYTIEELSMAPEGANMGLGCGNPHRKAYIQPGEIVLDLGSGAGLDCSVAENRDDLFLKGGFYEKNTKQYI
ncbi:MAG: hypothetical protein ACI4TF_10330 [Oliverpabstia sp.]